jgi:oligopeptide/dipeptide ABC transporter ATP-binding protein
MFSNEDLLQVKNVTKHILLKRPEAVTRRNILKDVSFGVKRSKSFGLLGLPGCGKSSLVKLILGDSIPDAGEILLDGKNVSQMTTGEVHCMIRCFLHTSTPRIDDSRTFSQAIGKSFAECEALGCPAGKQVSEVATRMAQVVNLESRLEEPIRLGDERKTELAMALVSNPRLLIIGQHLGKSSEQQQENLKILEEAKEKLGLTYLFVQESPDPIDRVCDTVATMFLGEIVEVGEDFTEESLHPYSRLLWESEHRYQRGFSSLSPFLEVPGCSFHPLCSFAMGICVHETPRLNEISKNHWVACHLYKIVTDTLHSREDR